MKELCPSTEQTEVLARSCRRAEGSVAPRVESKSIPGRGRNREVRVNGRPAQEAAGRAVCIGITARSSAGVGSNDSWGVTDCVVAIELSRTGGGREPALGSSGATRVQILGARRAAFGQDKSSPDAVTSLGCCSGFIPRWRPESRDKPAPTANRADASFWESGPTGVNRLRP